MADFRPSNVLLELQGLDGLDEEQVLALLGEPETTDIHIRKDSHPTPEMPHAPKYLVYPVDFRDVSLSVISPRAQVIDFGQSFDTSQGPPPAAFGIPANYAAPEVVLDNSGSTAMDLWSLGCTLYEIRLGQRLFDVFQLLALSKKSYMDEIASLLGEPQIRGQSTTPNQTTNQTPVRLPLVRLRAMTEILVSMRKWNVPVPSKRNSPVATTVLESDAPIRGFRSFQKLRLRPWRICWRDC
jgi:serine/threonine protein kinase